MSRFPKPRIVDSFEPTPNEKFLAERVPVLEARLKAALQDVQDQRIRREAAEMREENLLMENELLRKEVKFLESVHSAVPPKTGPLIRRLRNPNHWH